MNMRLKGCRPRRGERQQIFIDIYSNNYNFTCQISIAYQAIDLMKFAGY
jgi:hypothetical protein